MTFLFFDILNAFLASSCIFVQIKKYLRWRGVKIFLQNGSATRKSQVGWPLTFYLKEQYAASFCRSCFKYEVRSLNTQHFHFSYKNVLFMGQSDLDPRKIDLNLYGNLPIEILYQYAYIAQLERLNYLIITTFLRKGSAYRCEITWEQERGFNGNDVTWTSIHWKNECIIPTQYEIYLIHCQWEPSSTSD